MYIVQRWMFHNGEQNTIILLYCIVEPWMEANWERLYHTSVGLSGDESNPRDDC